MKDKSKVKFPCRNCKHFKICGESGRTEYCAGRELKTKGKSKNSRITRERV